MKLLHRLDRWFEMAIRWVMVILFLTGFIIYLSQLALRWLGESWIHGHVVIQYLLVMASLMGAGYAVRHNENIKIELFRNLAGRPLIRLMVNGISVMVTVLILYVFAAFSIAYPYDSRWKWLLNFPYFFLFTASLVFYLRIIGEVLEEKRKKNQGPV